MLYNNNKQTNEPNKLCLHMSYFEFCLDKSASIIFIA